MLKGKGKMLTLPRTVGRVAVLLSAGALALTPLLAQVEMTGDIVAELPGELSLDAVAFAGNAPGQNRMDVFIQVGYDALTFVKQGEAYVASYEVTLSVLDSSRAQVTEKTWSEEVKTSDFNESVASNAYSLSRRVVPVTPGIYFLSLQVRDGESRRVRKITRQILVSDMNGSGLSLSDIMLLNRVSAEGEKRSIIPNVSSNLGEVSEPAYFFIEIYNKMPIDSVRLVVSVLSAKGERVLETDTILGIQSGKNEQILRFDHTGLSLGDYRLFARAFPVRPWPSPDTVYLAESNRPFFVRLRGLPRDIKDIDLAVDQLRYIAREGEYNHIDDAPNPEEKLKRFMEFWKKRDPNPSTPRNERMEQYYRRVEYANKHFSHYIDGWRTDMGMVYIIFGPPNNVERHPFDPDSKPYEVWVYYDLNYYFVFEDRTGFGDYRLTTPLSEVWNRRPY